MNQDHRGRILEALSIASEGELVDLSHPMFVGMPVLGFHIPYTLTLQNRHGDNARPGNTSYANEIMIFSAHTGTHVDALGHISRAGHLHGGANAATEQTPVGLKSKDASSIPPVIGRGVLLDVLETLEPDVDHLPGGYAIDGEHLERAAEGVSLEPGDVVLVRTGWAKLWRTGGFADGREGFPGVSPDGASWLLERSPLMVGADTPTFEVAPTLGESVHGMMLVDGGVHIIENLDLESLSRTGRREFLFIMLPLMLDGASGSPTRPVAII